MLHKYRTFYSSDMDGLTNFYNNSSNKVATDANPWAEVEFDNSPFSRVKRAGSYGTNWQLNTHPGRAVKIQHSINTASQNVRRYTLTSSGTGTLVWPSSNIYPSGTLTIETIWDELGDITQMQGAVRTFTDHHGKVIMKEAFRTNSESFRTYYVYDIYDRLRYIVPPLADGATSPTGWVYEYRYDNLNRVVEALVPGGSSNFTIYDNRRRPVLFQDSKQRQSNEWSFVKYDFLDRPILTGIITDSKTRVQMQNHVNDQIASFETRGGTVHGYTNNSWPQESNANKYLTVTYYDDYGFAGSWGATYNFEAHVGQPVYLNRPKGLVTGGKVKVTDGTNHTWLKSVQYYNYDYLPIVSVFDHHLGQYDKIFTDYYFDGNPKEVTHKHRVDASTEIVQNKKYQYDHAGRLTEVRHEVGNRNVILAKYEYNELGQLIDKKLHSEDNGANFEQSVDYRYGIRGWLTSINNARRTNNINNNDEDNDLYGMELEYGWSGNISNTRWGNSEMTNTQNHRYNYTYDRLNQLTLAQYSFQNNLSTTNSGHYNEQASYDKHGNILTMSRNQGNTTIDNLQYEYQQNRLLKVTDQTGNPNGFKDGTNQSVEYGYDSNGNLSFDLNKGVSSIVYDRNNMPKQVTMQNGENIKFLYDDAGNKLRQAFYNDSTLVDQVDFTGGFLYKNGQLKEIATSEGRILVNKVGSSYVFDYQYFLTDHLGNVRVMFGATTNTFKAIMESENAMEEESMFMNIAETRVSHFNYTEADEKTANPNKSSLVNPHLVSKDGERRVMGPATRVKVYPGDEVNMEVQAMYVGSQRGELHANAGSFIFSAFTAAFGILPVGETHQLYSTLQEALGMTALIPVDKDEAPAGYLNYIFVDEDFKNPVVGFTRVSKSANGDWEKLESNFTASEAGHLFVYVSNEGKEDVNIYFDDFIIMSRSAVTALQIDDYYPYGLPIKPLAYKDPDISHINRFMYQTKYWYDDGISPLEVYDFHARMYDPVLGRFLGVDPQNQFASPYTGMGNNPAMMVDPDGEFAFVAAAFLVKKAVVALKAAKVAKGLAAAAKATKGAIGVGKAATASKISAFMGKATSTKAITTGLKTGAINTISSYNANEGLGWNTLGDFAAGFVGGAIGVGAENKLIGMGAGGLANWGVNGASFDYQGAQNFVGGALSSYVGMGKAVKGKQAIFKQSEGMKTLVSFKKENVMTKTLMKHGDNFIKYGLQNNAYDFAYSKEKDFRSRGWGHLELFAWGGLSGTYQGFSWENEIGFGQELLYVAFDWGVNGAIKKRYRGVKIDGSQANKLGLGYLKWIENLFIFY